MSQSFHSEPKNIFVVLGPPRSGTSVVARGLKALGIDLGKKLTPADAKWNPKGFWEDSDVVYNINGKIFSELNFSADDNCLLTRELQKSPKLNNLNKAAVDLLNQRFAETNYWGFKDPNTSKLMTFWQSVFNHLQVNENYIIALRNPLGTASSYKRLKDSPIDLEIGLIKWLLHIVPAIDETHGKKRVVVNYETILQNPLKQLERIKSHLNIALPLDSSEVTAYANQFIDKSLTHYEVTYDDLKNNAAITVVPLCLRVYDLMLQLAHDEVKFDDALFVEQWREIKIEVEKSLPVYSYIDTLLKRNVLLRKELHSIKKSPVWKLNYPLRVAENYIRVVLRKLRNREHRFKV